MFRANLAFFLDRKTRGSWSHRARFPVSLPADCFGVCVASSEDASCDDYVVARLRELGLRWVRVDYGYDAAGSFVERFVRRLVQEGFQVALHLAPTKQEVEAITRPDGADRWRGFLRDTFERFGSDVEFLEIGSTVNRRRWSGFTMPLFFRAWDIAWEEAQSHRAVLAGPNVTDFEPFYNSAILHHLGRLGRLPAIHTDNLFVERATEPEAFDHKILSPALASWIKFNTIKKASLLGAISRWAGVSRTFSTQASWSLRRIRRVLEDAEEQQADYVTRYCCLAAASGGVDRIYWGPLIGQREGLIDDGTTFFPEVFHVAFYGRVNGQVTDYRVRPAFRAFQTANRLLPGSMFVRSVDATGSLEMLEFQTATHTLHVVWCRNGYCARAVDCYSQDTLADAEAHDRDGHILPAAPELFTQRPVYLRWPKGMTIRQHSSPGTMSEVRLSSASTAKYAPIENEDWRGLALISIGDTTFESDAILPHRFPPMGSADAKTLRNKRNRVWAVPSPWYASQKMVVKHFRPARGLRGWFQRSRPSKALRSWNGAHELLRRGIPTPQPIAWLEHPSQPRESESYYLCEAFDGGSSARHAFYAFNEGASEFLGAPAVEIYRAIAAVVAKMHRRGVFFRDLSAGNLLLRRSENVGVECSLIDTARARFGSKTVSVRQRLADLMRLCHPLVWRERERFLRTYFEAAEIRFSPWMRLAFHYYDGKHHLKKRTTFLTVVNLAVSCLNSTEALEGLWILQ